MSTTLPLAEMTVCPITIGREQEIERLGRLIEQLQAGHGTTVLITGEAGIGKSRLVAEARARAVSLGAGVLQGAAFELDRSVPYGAITDLLRTRCGQIATGRAGCVSCLSVRQCRCSTTPVRGGLVASGSTPADQWSN